MIKHPASRSDITLPLLIDYIDALLPSLTAPSDTPNTVEQTHNITELLWIVQDKNARLVLKAQFKDHLNSQSNHSAVKDSDKLQIVTLIELTQQQRPERYDLACFWLPTLSPELLQQYIPLLMRFRDLYAAHLLIAIDHTIDLKAYGFTPFDILDEQSIEANVVNQDEALESSESIKPLSSVAATLWQFNLYDYKQLPNWLNADYWANPENWGKHRW